MHELYYHDKKLNELIVVVMGLGVHGGGLGACQFFLQHGAKVIISEQKTKKDISTSLDKLKEFNFELETEGHKQSTLQKADILIKNPIISPQLDILAGISCIENDISLFLRWTSNPILAISGTKGKSSTSYYLYQLLEKYYPKVYLAGNMGISPLNFLLDRNFDPHAPVILELSSWQLRDISLNYLRARIALVTNIYPDHLDTYPSLTHYINDKKKLSQIQKKGDFFLHNYSDPYIRLWKIPLELTIPLLTSLSTKNSPYPIFLDEETQKNIPPCLYYENSILYRSKKYQNLSPHIEKLISLNIPLGVSIENVFFSVIMAYYYGMPLSVIEQNIPFLKNLEHRLEYVLTIKGSAIYNDSSATIPEAIIFSIHTLNKPVILICGGNDKDLDFSILSNMTQYIIYAIILMGSASEKIITILKKEKINYAPMTSSLTKACQLALKKVKPGQDILFSPGATSFASFHNAYHRGAEFKKIIRKLCSSSRLD